VVFTAVDVARFAAYGAGVDGESRPDNDSVSAELLGFFDCKLDNAQSKAGWSLDGIYEPEHDVGSGGPPVVDRYSSAGLNECSRAGGPIVLLADIRMKRCRPAA